MQKSLPTKFAKGRIPRFRPQDKKGCLQRRDNLVREAVVDGFLGGHEEIPVGVRGDFFNGLAGGLRKDFVQFAPHSLHLLRLNVQVDRRAAHLPHDEGLVNHHPRAREQEPAPLLGSAQQYGTHAHRDSRDHHLYGGLHELHRVVNRHARAYRAAGRAEVKGYFLLAVEHVEIEELLHYFRCGLVSHFAPEKYFALLKKALLDFGLDRHLCRVLRLAIFVHNYFCVLSVMKCPFLRRKRAWQSRKSHSLPAGWEESRIRSPNPP